MKLSRAPLVCAALVVVGVVALGSSALAATRPDDRAGPLGAGVAAVSPAAAHPDGRVGVRGVGTDVVVSPAAAHPDSSVGIRGPGPVAVADSGGTDWTTIGIGIASGIAAVVILVGVVATMRHGGHRPHRPIPMH